MGPYALVVIIRALFAAVVALAVLVAPAITRVGEASAAVPDHHAQMMTKGHCDPAPDSDQEKSSTSSCCFQTCTAVAPEPAAPPAHQAVLGAVKAPERRTFLVGLPAEIATPPPRAG